MIDAFRFDMLAIKTVYNRFNRLDLKYDSVYNTDITGVQVTSAFASRQPVKICLTLQRHYGHKTLKINVRMILTI